MLGYGYPMWNFHLHIRECCDSMSFLSVCRDISSGHILYYFILIHGFLKLSKGYFPRILSDSDGFGNLYKLFDCVLEKEGV